MATFLTKREAKQRQESDRQQKREQKLRHKDLLWAARRRFLNDTEWYELHVLDRTYGKWGPEQAAYEFGILEELREFYRRHEVGSKSPELNALEKHLAMHKERQDREAKEKSKKIVHAHPDLKKLASTSK